MPWSLLPKAAQLVPLYHIESFYGSDRVDSEMDNMTHGLQMTVGNCGFHSCGYNQLKIENTQKNKIVSALNMCAHFFFFSKPYGVKTAYIAFMLF